MQPTAMTGRLFTTQSGTDGSRSLNSCFPMEPRSTRNQKAFVFHSWRFFRIHWGAFHFAAFNGSIRLLNMLLEQGLDPTAADFNMTRPIHFACECGPVDSIKFFIEHGSGVDTQDNNGMTPVLFAASAGKLSHIVFLVSQGADMLARDKNGLGILHCALKNGHMDLIDYLIREKVPLNEPTNKGWTPLHYAAENNLPTAVTALLDSGASINQANQYGVSFLLIEHHSTRLPSSIFPTSFKFSSTTVPTSPSATNTTKQHSTGPTALGQQRQQRCSSAVALFPPHPYVKANFLQHEGVDSRARTRRTDDPGVAI